MPIFWAMSMISTLSKPITGRNTGMVTTLSVVPRAVMVWLATWPMLSPVIRALACSICATRSAMRIIKRRMISVV